MMNKKGFTLVELMVVIVIIGVLAAVALPKFADAINKSKCSEAPNILGQIGSGEATYYAENSVYVPFAVIAAGAANPAGATLIGVNVKSNTFTYAVAHTANDQDFTATAAIRADLGKVGDGTSISLDDNGNKGIGAVAGGGSETLAATYIKSWN